MAKGTGYKQSGRAGLAPDPQWWMEEIRKGIEYRNKNAQRHKWEKWRKWYRGIYSAQELPVNVYFKMLRTMVPRVYFRNPAVSITPRKRQAGQLDFWVFSQLLESVDNALFDRMKLKYSMKKAVQDAFMFGTGILKLGYGGQFSPTPDPVETTEDPGKGSHKLEYHSFVLPEMPWVLRVPTSRFIVPAHSLDWPSCRWCAHEERRHIDDVQDDSRFKNVKDLSPGVLVQPGEDALGKLADQVSVIEIRDKRSGQVFVLAPTQKEKNLALEDDTLQFETRLPFFPIQFNPDDDGFWAVPDAQILEPHQTEINEIRRILRIHRRLSLLKYCLKEGAISPDEVAKLVSPNEVGSIIKFGKDVQSIDSVFKEINAGDLPAGLLKMDQLEEHVVQEVLGLGVNQFGEYAPGSADRSATEAAIVNQATQIRTDERRDIVADVVVDLTEHLNNIVLNKWSGEQIVAIAGPANEQIWVNFKTEELKSLEYDVKVDPDSSIPETRQVRRENAVKVMTTYQQNQFIDGQKMTKWSLNEIGGPAMIDLMINGGNGAPPQPLVQPGQPGSTPNQPIPTGEVIRRIAARRQGGG